MEKIKSKEAIILLGVLATLLFLIVPTVNSQPDDEVDGDAVFNLIHYNIGDPCTCSGGEDGCCVGAYICVQLQAGPNSGDYIIGMQCQGPQGSKCETRGDGVPYCPWGPVQKIGEVLFPDKPSFLE